VKKGENERSELGHLKSGGEGAKKVKNVKFVLGIGII